MQTGITKLTVEGVKGLDGTYDLGQRVLVQGGVGSGKSGLLDALRFALLGSVPGQGKTVGATARLFDASGGRVSVELGDGRVFGHAYTPKGKRKIEAHASWVTDPDAQVDEITKQIRGLIGSTEEEAIEVLYADAITKCTPQQRATRLRQVLESGGDPEWRAAAVQAMTGRRLHGGGTEVEVPSLTKSARAVADALMGDALQEITEDEVLAREVRALAEALTGTSLGDLDGALQEANRLKRKWDADMREAQGAQQVAEKEAAEYPPGGISPGEAKRTLETLARVAEAALKDVDRGSELEQRLVNAEAELADAAAMLEGMPDDPKGDVARRRQDARDLRDQADATVISERPERPADPTMSAEALKAEQDLRQLLPSLEERLTRLKTKRPEPPTVATSADVDAVVERLFGTLDSYGFGAEVEAALQQFRTVWNARVEKGDVWDKHRQQLQQHEAAVEDLERQIRDTNQRIQQVVEGERERIERERAAIMAQYRKDDAKATVAIERAKEARDADRQRALLIEQEADADAAKWAEADEVHARAEAVVKKCREDLAGTPSMDALREAREKAEAAVEKARFDLLAAEKRAACVQALRAAERRLHEARAKSALYAAAEWAMQRVREHELSEAKAQLLTPMQAFYDGAELGYTPVLNAAKGKVEFGLQIDPGDAKSVRQVEALSGGEFVLYATALAAALLSLRKPDLRLMLVEAVECGLSRFGGVSVELLKGIAAVDKYVATTLVASNLPLSEDVAEADPMGEWVTLSV